LYISPMNKLIISITAFFLFSCVSSQQIGLKENWIDERDVMALRDMPLDEWIQKSGLPTLVEIVGDTNIYYYNYRPTLYAVAIYDSTTFIKSWGTASEQKPSLANKAEVWGSRKDVMQIKVVGGLVISAIITEGPDKKVFVRDLTGNIILDPNSGFNTNISKEQKVDNSFKEYSKIFSNLHGAASAPAQPPVAPPPEAAPAPPPPAPAPAPVAPPPPPPHAAPAPPPPAPAPAPVAPPPPPPHAAPPPPPHAAPAPPPPHDAPPPPPPPPAQ